MLIKYGLDCRAPAALAMTNKVFYD